jgi:tetratricopeptide (TPR) repeat protein
MTEPAEAETAPDDARLTAAETARREGDPLAMYDIAQSALRDGSAHPRFQFLAALALAQMGDTAGAEGFYRAFALGERPDDEDALALGGRLQKDRALTAEGVERRLRFSLASQTYRRAYAVRSGYFPLINAATTAWAAGDVGAARAMAKEVLKHPDIAKDGRFFPAVSRAEALILLGRTDEAAEALSQAVANAGAWHGERASAWRQLNWLCESVGLAPVEQESLLSALRAPPVLTYTGHMFRAGGEGERDVAARITAALDRLGSTIAYGALACGADILIAEAVLARGGELHAVLPFRVSDFETASVTPGGPGWGPRFRACLDRAASVTIATRAEDVRDDGHFAYGALLAMGLTQLRAGQLAAEAVQIAVWDGEPARGASGAGVDVAVWRRLGRETLVIDPGAIDRELDRSIHASAAPQTARTVRAILFSHYRGYVDLSEKTVPEFVRRVMVPIAEVLERRGKAVRGRNTWGDALYLVVESPADAAEIALEILDALRDVRLGPDTPGAREGVGIALHYGPIYQEIDHVTGLDGFYGTEVTLTARIEPRAIPGEILTTRAFAAILAVTAPERFSPRYIGQIELEKGYGAEPVYRLERRV